MLQNPLAQVLGIVPAEPAFQLYQRVRSHYVRDGFQVLDDEGIIVGVLWSPGFNYFGYDRGWWYIVYWTSMPSSSWLRVPHIEQEAEEDLRAI